jgi:hypothetical protein
MSIAPVESMHYRSKSAGSFLAIERKRSNWRKNVVKPQDTPPNSTLPARGDDLDYVVKATVQRTHPLSQPGK